jgi:antitoxin ParD1/3/4
MLTAEIPAEFESFVQSQVATGHYRSAQDLLSDALRLLRNKKLHALRKDLQVGLDELDRGEEIVIEDERALKQFFDDLEAEARAEIEAERSR